MHGYRIRSWGSAPAWESFDVSSPAVDEARIRVEACGVGRTVVNYIDGNLSVDPSLLPRVPGHELVGRVVEVGSSEHDHLVGRRVTAYFYLSCGVCEDCRNDREPRCPDLAGRIGVHRDGGYAEECVLPVWNLVPIDDDLSAAGASVIADAVATPVHIARRAGIGAGDRVVVVGAGGGVGIHMVQVAAAQGAEVAGIDLGEEKMTTIEAFASAFDARDGISSLDQDRLFAAGRPTVVVDFAGGPEVATWALDAMASGGRMVMLSSFGVAEVPLPPRRMVFGELTVMGSLYASKAEVAEAAELVASGRVQPVIGATTGSDGVLELHQRILDGSLIGRGAVLWS